MCERYVRIFVKHSSAIHEKKRYFVSSIILNLTYINLGCVSDYDCPKEKECDMDMYSTTKNRCVPMRCMEDRIKIGGSIKDASGMELNKTQAAIFVGDTSEFCCEEGKCKK